MNSLGLFRHEGKTFLGFYSCGYRNENGIRLRYFCLDTDFIMSHTAFYKTCARNIATLQGILGRVPTFTQMDYIVLSQHLKPLLSISKSLSGTRVESYDRPTDTYIQLLMIISCRHLSAISFDTALLRDPHILYLCQQSIRTTPIASAPAQELDLPSVLNHIKSIANAIIRPKLPTAQGPERNDDIAELSHAQNRLRSLLTSSNDPVDILLYRSRLQALLWTIRHTCIEDYRLHVVQLT